MGHKPIRQRKRFLLYLAGGLMGVLLLGACTIGPPPIGNHAPPLADIGRHIEEGDVLLLQGDYEAARREACLQLERFPGQADDRAFYLLGMVWVHPDNPRRDIHRADVCFRRIEDRYPDSPLLAGATTWRAVIAQLEENEQSLAQMQTASLALKQQLKAEAAKGRLLEERLQQMKAIDLNLE
jgi:hypothetical protein